jgi:hypothetical protein
MRYYYTYSDELEDNEVKTSLRKIVGLFMLIWCFKIYTIITINISKSKVQPIDQH